MSLARFGAERCETKIRYVREYEIFISRKLQYKKIVSTKTILDLFSQGTCSESESQINEDFNNTQNIK